MEHSFEYRAVGLRRITLVWKQKEEDTALRHRNEETNTQHDRRRTAISSAARLCDSGEPPIITGTDSPIRFASGFTYTSYWEQPQLCQFDTPEERALGAAIANFADDEYGYAPWPATEFGRNTRRHGVRGAAALAGTTRQRGAE